MVLSGSVCQRSFVASSLPSVIHIATAPVSEIATRSEDLEDENLLYNLLAEITGSPQETILDNQSYEEIGLSVTAGTGAREWLSSPRGRWTDNVVSDGIFLMNQGSMRSALLASRQQAFAHDALALLLQPNPLRQALMTDLLVLKAGNRAPVLERIAPDLMRQTELMGCLGLGISCLLAGASDDKRVEAFISELYTNEIPISGSRPVSSQPLGALLGNARHIGIATLLVGAHRGIEHLTSGEYVAALQTVSAAGGMLMVVISAGAAANLLVQYMERKRSSGKRRKRRM